jgi:hypothetical protein
MLRRRNDTSLRKPVARPSVRAPVKGKIRHPEWATKRPTTFPARRRATALGMSSNPTGTVGIPPERGAVELGGREVALALQRSQMGGYPDAWALTIQHAAVNRTSVPCTKGSKAGRTASMTWARVRSSLP